jgi:protoheme IX farnesyltransferase
VVQLIVFCAVIGMFLAVPGWPPLVPTLAATAGIWLVAAAAAAFNCLVEQQIDRRMTRTAWRPTAKGELTNTQALVFSALLCGAGAALLLTWVNAITLWLTLATFIGYAVIYTLVLKPITPQNIVIGGASGAMPPVLGWAAMRGEASADAWLLCLIIFLWTPPHFWALALYRTEDYRKAGLPMLPVTHGPDFTKLHVFLYTLVLFAGTLLPFVSGLSGLAVPGLRRGAGFMFSGLRVQAVAPLLATSWRASTFRFSILYLSLLFAALLVDHYVPYAR